MSAAGTAIAYMGDHRAMLDRLGAHDKLVASLRREIEGLRTELRTTTEPLELKLKARDEEIANIRAQLAAVELAAAECGRCG